MTTNKVVILFLAGGVVFIFAMNIWGGWAEKTYKRFKDNSFMWLGMDLFGISRTQDSSIRFLKTISWIGMILVVASIITVMVLAK